MAYDLNTIEPDYISSISGNFSSAATVKGQHVVTGLKEGQSINITPLGNGYFEISSPFIGTGGGSIFRVNNEPLYMDSGNFVGVSGVEIVRSGDEGILVANGIKFYADGNRLYAPALIDGSGTYVNVNGNNIRIDFSSGYLNGHYATISGLDATGLALIELIQTSSAGVSSLNGQSGTLSLTGLGNIRSTFVSDTFNFSGKNPSVSSTSEYVSGRYQYCTQTGITGDHLILGFMASKEITGVIFNDTLTTYETVGASIAVTGYPENAGTLSWRTHDNNVSTYWDGGQKCFLNIKLTEPSLVNGYYGKTYVFNRPVYTSYFYATNDDSEWPIPTDFNLKWILLDSVADPFGTIEGGRTFTNTNEYKYYCWTGNANVNIYIYEFDLLGLTKSGLVSFDEIDGQNIGSGVGIYYDTINGLSKFKSLTGQNGITVQEASDGKSILIGSQGLDGRKIMQRYDWYIDNTTPKTGINNIYYIGNTQELSGFFANYKNPSTGITAIDIEVSNSYTGSWESIFITTPKFLSGEYLSQQIYSFGKDYLSGQHWMRMNIVSGLGDGSGLTTQLFATY